MDVILDHGSSLAASVWKRYLNLRDDQQLIWTNQQVDQHINKLRQPWVMAVAQQELTAFVLFTQVAEVLEILYLETSPSWRSQGKMIFLLQNLVKTHRAVELWLEVHSGNRAAQALYKKIGFEQCGRRKNYYSDGGDCLLLSLFCGHS